MKLPCSTITGSGPEAPSDLSCHLWINEDNENIAGHSLVLLNMSDALPYHTKWVIGLAYRDMQIKLMGSTSLFLRRYYVRVV